MSKEIVNTEIIYQCPIKDCGKIIKRLIVHAGPLLPIDLYGANRCPHCGESYHTFFKIQSN